MIIEINVLNNKEQKITDLEVSIGPTVALISVKRHVTTLGVCQYTVVSYGATIPRGGVSTTVALPVPVAVVTSLEATQM